MADQALINGLNEQLNREVSTFLRYMLQGASIKGAEHETVRKMYLSEVPDEVGHAQELANQIVRMGGTPKLDPDLSPPPKSVETMLKADADAERDDVKHYAALADQAGKQGLFALKLQMEKQAGDEDEHGREMLRLLGE